MRLTSLLLISAGLACGPDKTDGETTGTSTGTSTGEADTTAGASGVPTSDGPGEGSGDSSAGGTGTSETGEPGTSAATTGPGDGCGALQSRAQCEQDPACMAVVGEALDFAGCMPGQTFVACMPRMACDDSIQDVCQEEPGMEVYRLPNGCVPPGFEPCVPGDLPLCGASECEQLPQQGCLANPACTAILGAPHVEQDGEVCVDFGMQAFLACAQGDIACPPVIASVCPEGQPDMVFDTPSGCVPSGFMPCDAPAPECQ
jgi:hypothetical protein